MEIDKEEREMSKLAKEGIIWIQDSEIYCADKTLYKDAGEFLRAVIAHIQKHVDDVGMQEWECGWFETPKYEAYISRVGSQWMVHRINSDYHEPPFWELADSSGRGHRIVWLIDFMDR